ncbi:MAG: hypothetical protein IPM92_16165 [Saprospiraceae bacterium]|nr:hypothetical protein [Saprospiraceae bacterium]
MRHTLYSILFWSCLLFIACDEDVPSGKNTHELLHLSSEPYTLRAIDHYLLLLKNDATTNDDVYILRRDFKENFTKSLELASIDETQNGIELRLVDGQSIKLSIQSKDRADFFGNSLSKVSGAYHHKLFYNQNGILDEPEVEYIKCKCYTNSTSEKCDAGGKGSPDCNISGSATGAGTGIQEKCSVKCSSGFYACCKSV